MRYDLIHYIYSTVEQTTHTAEPLMRTMWNEFPEDQRFWNVFTQFMFGDSILVAPKVTRPTGVYENMHKQEVKYLLPESETWYNYYSKAQVDNTSDWVTTALPDLEQAVFVRAGTVLPILLHEDCPSILSCINNDVRLEVYPDANEMAFGSMYLDDGSSFNYTDKEAGSARISLQYSKQRLTVSTEYGHSYDDMPNVATIAVYGIQKAPVSVTNDHTKAQVDFIYEPSTEAVYIVLDQNTLLINADITLTMM